jgi:hypothetical protein
MAKAKYQAEQIIPMMREAEVEIGKGKTVSQSGSPVLDAPLDFRCSYSYIDKHIMTNAGNYIQCV